MCPGYVDSRSLFILEGHYRKTLKTKSSSGANITIFEFKALISKGYRDVFLQQQIRTQVGGYILPQVSQQAKSAENVRTPFSFTETLLEITSH